MGLMGPMGPMGPMGLMGVMMVMMVMGLMGLMGVMGLMGPMGQWGWATALFEGVGEVVFVEDGVASGEEGGEEFLGVVEGVDKVGFVGGEACG